MQSFHRELLTPSPVQTVLAEALPAITVPLGRHSYKVRTHSEVGVTWVRAYRPWWVWILTAVTFPMGLLFYLLLTEEATVVMSLEPSPQGTIVRVAGNAPTDVRHAFESMTV